MKDRFGYDWSEFQGRPFWSKPLIGRRMFFRHAAAAIGGYFLLPGRPMETIARAQPATRGTAKYCIFIMLSGAPSHIDTFDLKEGLWTPSTFEPTTYGDIRFPRGLMPRIAEHLDSILLARSVRAWAGVHGLMQSWVQIGRNPTAALSKISPHIGSVVSIELTDDNQILPAFLAINGTPPAGSGYFEAKHSPFVVTGGAPLPNTTHATGAARFDTRYALLRDIDAEWRGVKDVGPGPLEMAAWNERARGLMYNSDVNNIFALSQDERNRYGNAAFGNACITARNLIRANMGTRFIQITLGGWDHHQNIYAANAGLTTLARQFDNGLGTLLGDLKADGLLDQTLIVAQGEFGRTVGPLNSGAGRDHFLQQSVLFAGGGVRGGRALGSTNEAGSETADPGWSGDRDIRTEDIEATIYSAMGIDWTTVRHDDPLKRGFEYVPVDSRYQFRPVDEIW